MYFRRNAMKWIERIALVVIFIFILGFATYSVVLANGRNCNECNGRTLGDCGDCSTTCDYANCSGISP